MSPASRVPERDFNEDLAAAYAKWQATWDALHHLEYDFVWTKDEDAVLKHLRNAHRWMLSTKTSLKKLAIERAD